MPAVWQIYLIFTVLVESAIVAPLAPRGRRWVSLRCCVLANLFTHPLLSTLLAAGVGPLAVLEVLVIVVEAVAYRFVVGLTWKRSYVLAVATNAVSWGISIVL